MLDDGVKFDIRIAPGLDGFNMHRIHPHYLLNKKLFQCNFDKNLFSGDIRRTAKRSKSKCGHMSGFSSWLYIFTRNSGPVTSYAKVCFLPNLRAPNLIFSGNVGLFIFPFPGLISYYLRGCGQHTVARATRVTRQYEPNVTVTFSLLAMPRGRI